MRLKPVYLAWLLAFVTAGLYSCSDSRIYDRYHDFPQHVWPVDSVQKFTFEVNDTSTAYDFFYKVRNAADYEYYNLYVRFSLEDSLHQEIASELQEMILFDPKTGKPYGGGLGDIFDHEFPALSGFKFPYRGMFTFRVVQYMRTDPLTGIHAIGLRIDKVKSD